MSRLNHLDKNLDCLMKSVRRASVFFLLNLKWRALWLNCYMDEIKKQLSRLKGTRIVYKMPLIKYACVHLNNIQRCIVKSFRVAFVLQFWNLKWRDF